MPDLQPSRRMALQTFALAAGSVAVQPIIAAAAPGKEADWERVRAAFPPQRPLLNLNNASVSPPPIAVQEAVIRAYRFQNENPDVNMWDKLDNSLPSIKAKLAKMADCSVDEIALNRNSTEGLCTAIFGIPLKAGDEALLSAWDYASMRAAWFQREAREGIKVAPVTFDLMDDDDHIVAAYARAITPGTKVMQLTHMIHWTGRVLPVKRLCALAREHGIQTVVDAAQSFAQFPISFRDLGCDFFITSLHKWMCAPISNGMLIVRNDRIDATWPLLAPYDPPPLRIEKFEHWNLGTYNSAEQSGIEPAIDFHSSIGTTRIHARLAELTRHWSSQARDIPGFRLHTPLDTPELAAVSLFSIAGQDHKALEKRLVDEHRIHVKFRSVNGLVGLRVSPQIYTRKAELDQFVAALRQVVKAI